MTQQEKCKAYEINGARRWHPEYSVYAHDVFNVLVSICVGWVASHSHRYVSQGNLSSTTTKLHDHTLRNTKTMWKQQKRRRNDKGKRHSEVHMKSRKMPTYREEEKNTISSDRKRSHSQQDKNGCCWVKVCKTHRSEDEKKENDKSWS